MTGSSYTRLHDKIRQALSRKGIRDAMYTAMKRGRDNRNQAVGLLPGGETFRKKVRETKLRCQAKQAELVDRFAEKARQRGASVFMADDGAEAIDYVLKIARERNARIVAKSKSLTSEEIEINEPLEEAGMEVIETGTCCGMAGTFGLKEGMLGYELSQAVGQPLFDAFKNSSVEAIVTESSVCKIQLLEGTGLRVYHPLEIPC